MNKNRMLLGTALSVSVGILLLLSTPVLAKNDRNTGDTVSERPGWGHGDTNHEHTGPDGFGASNERPGNGYGDRNHIHYGYGYGYMIHNQYRITDDQQDE